MNYQQDVVVSAIRLRRRVLLAFNFVVAGCSAPRSLVHRFRESAWLEGIPIFCAAL